MNKKRNDLEILATILRVARNGAKKSHIVYKANLNFAIIKDYLDRLRESGLIIGPDGKNRMFKTTEKGIEYLNYFEGLRRFYFAREIAKPLSSQRSYEPSPNDFQRLPSITYSATVKNI